MDSMALPCKKLYCERYGKHNLIPLVYRKTKCVVFYKVKKNIPKVQCAKVRRIYATEYLQQGRRREVALKDEKSRFYVSHSHVQVSQCPRVVYSAQDGEQATGPKARSGRDRPAGQCAGGYKTRQIQKIVNKIEKRGLKMMRIYDIIRSPKLRLVMPSCTGSATRSVLNLNIFFQ